MKWQSRRGRRRSTYHRQDIRARVINRTRGTANYFIHGEVVVHWRGADGDGWCWYKEKSACPDLTALVPVPFQVPFTPPPWKPNKTRPRGTHQSLGNHNNAVGTHKGRVAVVPARVCTVEPLVQWIFRGYEQTQANMGVCGRKIERPLRPCAFFCLRQAQSALNTV